MKSYDLGIMVVYGCDTVDQLLYLLYIYYIVLQYINVYIYNICYRLNANNMFIPISRPM